MSQDPLQAARRQLDQERQAQQALQHALTSALQRPHTVTEIMVSATTVVDVDDKGTKMFIIALVTGEQIRVKLEVASARNISRLLIGRHGDLEVLEEGLNENGGPRG